MKLVYPGHHGGERWWRRSGQEGRVAGLWPGKSPWRSHADQARSRNSRNPCPWCRWLSPELLGSACRGGSSGACSCCGRRQDGPPHLLPRLTNGRCGRRGRSGAHGRRGFADTYSSFRSAAAPAAAAGRWTAVSPAPGRSQVAGTRSPAAWPLAGSRPRPQAGRRAAGRCADRETWLRPDQETCQTGWRRPPGLCLPGLLQPGCRAAGMPAARAVAVATGFDWFGARRAAAGRPDVTG